MVFPGTLLSISQNALQNLSEWLWCWCLPVNCQKCLWSTKLSLWTILSPACSLFQVALMTTWSKEVKWNLSANRERGTSPLSSSLSSGRVMPLSMQTIKKKREWMKLFWSRFCEGAMNSDGLSRKWCCNDRSMMAIAQTETNVFWCITYIILQQRQSQCNR